jgi:2-(1,2-epoxy-1,2-dihydrophenyl)acetyl-CoA isomerase
MIDRSPISPRYNTIRYGVRDSIAEIVLDRPDAANTFTPELLAELAQATTELATEESVRAVVLRGSGKNFCFGASVDMFIAAEGGGRPRLIRDLVTRFHNAVTRLARIEVPVLGVAHGMSVGGGVALLAACDVVIAAESSKFRLGWSGIGLSMDGGATSTLTRILGPRRTLELIYTNRVFTAAEAEAWGFVNWVVPDAEIESRAAKLAAELASGPTRALGICKRLVHDSATEAFEAQLEREAITITEVAGTADVDEGCRAFRERRAPRFAGK